MEPFIIEWEIGCLAISYFIICIEAKVCFFSCFTHGTAMSCVIMPVAMLPSWFPDSQSIFTNIKMLLGRELKCIGTKPLTW